MLRLRGPHQRVGYNRQRPSHVIRRQRRSTQKYPSSAGPKLAQQEATTGLRSMERQSVSLKCFSLHTERPELGSVWWVFPINDLTAQLANRRSGIWQRSSAARKETKTSCS